MLSKYFLENKKLWKLILIQHGNHMIKTLLNALTQKTGHN
jgi:hypothetical protein